MGIVRAVSGAALSVLLGVGVAVAVDRVPIDPASPSAVDRCTAGGQPCVERARVGAGPAVEYVTRVHAPNGPVLDDPSSRPRPRLIVSLRPGATARTRSASRALRALPRSGSEIVEVRDGHDLDAAIEELRADPSVLMVEPDREVRLFDTVPEDPLWIEQWGLRTIEAPAAWDHGTEVNDVIIAVLDTGIDLEHRDLAASIWVAPDGSRGYNCISDDANVADDHGHGTHVAGIIGASANADGNPSNDHGVAGVAWRARLLPMKFLDRFGVGMISDAITCYEKIAELIDDGANIRVTNNSWGGEERSFALRRAMVRLWFRNVTHVAAAGNEGRDTDLSPVFPASFFMPNLISVGSSGISDVPSPFTNFGLASVDLAAPGEYVMSTVPPGPCASCDPAGYAYGSGTSAAAPFVTGVVASIVQSRPGWRPRRVRDLLLDPASLAPSPLTSSTSGRLDFARARVAVDLAGTAPPRINRNPRFLTDRLRNRLLLAGQSLQLDISATDPDPADQVSVHARRPAVADLDTVAPLAWMIGTQLPQPAPAGPISLVGPRLAHAVSIPYVVSAADGRGGSARRQFAVTVLADADDDQPPSSVELLVSSTAAPAGSVIEFSTPAFDPDGGQIGWGYECHGAFGGFSAFEPMATFYTRTIFADGRFRCRAYVVDDELNLAVSPSVILEIGDDGREPPVARLHVDRREGQIPLVVELDASASHDDDGAIQSYAFSCGNRELQPAVIDSTASCTFTTAGPHVVRVTVVDDDFRADSIAVPIMALPVGTPSSAPAPTSVAE